MSVFKVLGGIACLSLFVGTGALAEMEGSSKVTHRSLADLSIDKFEQQGKNKMVAIGGEAIPVGDLAQQTRKGESQYFTGEGAKTAENLKDEDMKKSHKGISTQSAQ